MATNYELEHGVRFDQIAEKYDGQLEYPVRTIVRNQVIDLVRTRLGVRLLDAGCGTGELLISVADRVQAGVGFDVSEKSLAIARQKAQRAGHNHITFVHAGFSDLGHGQVLSDSYDVVVSTYAMHHLDHDEKRRVIAAMAELVRPAKGLVVLGDLMLPQPEVSAFRSQFAEAAYDPAHDTPDTVQQLVDAFQAARMHVHVRNVHPLAGIISASVE